MGEKNIAQRFLEIQKLKEHDSAKYMSCYENHVHAYYLEMYLFSKFHSARKLDKKYCSNKFCTTYICIWMYDYLKISAFRSTPLQKRQIYNYYTSFCLLDPSEFHTQHSSFPPPRHASICSLESSVACNMCTKVMAVKY